jgi:hypothetical protein
VAVPVVIAVDPHSADANMRKATWGKNTADGKHLPEMILSDTFITFFSHLKLDGKTPRN